MDIKTEKRHASVIKFLDGLFTVLFNKKTHAAVCFRFALIGALFGFSFLYSWTWWLGFFGLYFLLINFRFLNSSKLSLWCGFAFGLTAQMTVLSWFWSIYPLNWLGIENPAHAIGLIGVYWFFASLPYAIAKALLFLVLFRLPYKQFFLYKSGFVFAIAWVCSEILGSFLHSVVVLGPGGEFNAAFSFGYAGYLFADHGLAGRLAIIGGVYVLSFIYVFIGFLCFHFYFVQNKKRSALGMLCTTLVASQIPFNNPYIDDSLSVAAIETHFPQVVELTPEARDEKRRSVLETTKIALQSGNQYIILPEDSALSKSFQDEAAVFAFMRAFGQPDAVIVDSFKVAGEHSGENYVQASVYNLANETQYIVHKKMLAPQGEYLPYLALFMLQVLGFGEQATEYANRVDTLPRSIEQTSVPDTLPGVVFCYEAIAPYGIRRVAKNKEFVALVVSHAWFHEPYSLWNQLDQITKVNTLFARTTVYQASNANISKRY